MSYEKLESERDKLQSSLKKLFKYMDDGVLIRDISQDDKPEWAIKMLHLTMDLKEAYDLIKDK